MIRSKYLILVCLFCIIRFVSLGQSVGYNNMVRYQEGQEAFEGAKFGFDPYKTVQENREYYARMGYTLSYKYSDSEIYTFSGIGFASFLLLLFILSKQKKFESVN